MLDMFQLFPIVFIALTSYVLRLISILPFFQNRTDIMDNISQDNERSPLHISVFLGSGGHAGEMFRILENYREFLLQKENVLYIGYSDEESRIRFEKTVRSQCKVTYYKFLKAREVNAGFKNSFLGIIKTLLFSLFNVIHIRYCMLWKRHLVLLNGPGTCCILVLWFKVIELLFPISSSNVVYIESLARITTLSLTGRIVYWLADEFIVQWEDLKSHQAPRARYFGILT
ncbi:N-acetylglucosaminyldiphosphodolichol N-acetylglucosaminyltransferase anchoring subunit ALG14 NDAI_0A05570 [Naumovozyma dairenensis CBS 421]|uniref:UDP-N-acetylglucosamine transferase subunit ALG14 n=1 Tax=Naumovozyma dairenensis (strain ATCC 10597 / BCRC 20456 / CBS 421 / NBRC 0211 / NRRL Y-12639) TaxID=1071378 RepID=G0W4H4_NAUDC|nr:hypothetical protein NDAI_0A05570 [Naumovozyma dairenensis CBS 421]CCD22712.1 hypothetical protein NDAI_0A05570 [Naumovozyma dairenensis CBS 421]